MLSVTLTGAPLTAAATLGVEWSPNGGQTGTLVTIGDLPSGSRATSAAVDPEPPVDERLDGTLLDPDEGYLSFAWILLFEQGSVPANHAEGPFIGASTGSVLVALEKDTVPGGVFEQFFNGPLTAGVHHLQVRPYTQAELDALDACEAQAADPKRECPALRMHVSLAPQDLSTPVEVELDASVELPDLG